MEFEGTIVNRNNRAKEMVLYKVIAEKDAEIERLKEDLRRDNERWEVCCKQYKEELDAATLQLRALKSKEYRRTVRRKKAKVEVATV
jgi:hypothetical protein